MRPLKKSTVIALVAFCLGCAAAGVPQTGDPMKKLENGYALMNQGRPIPAEKLGEEALASFEQSGDKYGMAESHIFLGQLYKSQGYRSMADYFTKQGDYDPTNARSVSHSEKAAEIFLSIGNYTQAAKGQFAAANGSVNSDRAKACALYESSLESLKKGKVDNPGEAFQFNPSFESAEDMIKAFQSKYCGNDS